MRSNSAETAANRRRDDNSLGLTSTSRRRLKKESMSS